MLTNPSEMLENEESPREKYPHVERRKKLPDPVEKEKRANLWSLIKDCITKDINHVCLPVYFNEPLSHLQRCFEELEYSRLLDAAYEHGKRGNSLMRILHVAAFAVSGYACTEGRHYKSFNPLLGETYEGDYPDKGIRFICEKVSHHPMTISFHCEGTAWKIWGDITLRIRFLRRSIQLDPVGMLTLKFDDGETFQWNKVSTTLHNLITGKVYADHHGTMHIRSNGQYSCKLKFKNQNSSDRNSHQVQGPVEDDKGNKVATVVGKWDENMFYVPGDISLSSRGYNPVSDASLLWHRNPPGCCPNRFNFSAFAITLNELTPGLKEKLAPTDSRLRPDQRLMENGEYEKADSEKMRLERKQRTVMKQKGFVLKPKWFQKDPATGAFCYVGGYWESREEGNWDGCPNIFS